YWYRLRAQALVFLVFGGVSIAVLTILFRLVTPAGGFRNRHFIEVVGETVVVPSPENLRRFAAPFATIIGIFIGLTFSADWNRFALYTNRSAPGGITDPIFGQPLSFYFFTLPVMESITAWFLAISVITMIASIVLSMTDMTARFRGVSLALGILLLAVAARTYVSRYSLLFVRNNLFTGVRYVDDNIILPGMWFVIAALVLAAAVALANLRMARIRNLAIALILPALTYVVAGVLVPGYVSTFVVRPNELVRETPYIRHNIQFTRTAFGLDRVEEIPYDPRVTNTSFNPAAHAETLENIRLWDWRALQSTLRQLQEIRTYYEFADVDVDRYVLGGKPQAVMLATRELSLAKLPAGSRNWINERLIYTHGYGVTVNSVSQFTREGQPVFLLSNMPVEISQRDLKLTRPEIYFGELTDWPVYVKTRQKEFNYPEGEANNYSIYEGKGGIPMGSLFRRLLLAWTVGDLTKVPFSDDITAESALMMRRNIRERTAALAPFLEFDDDPYIVVGADGRLYWIMDAFTLSDRYPYSRPIGLGNRLPNYIRNSVKAVIDAYDGTVNFYIFDPDDLIIQAYQRMFPSLFKASAEMPDFLRAHIRYPELLFQAQAITYATYHVQNEQVFYNREDNWTIAQQGRTQTGQQASNIIESLYVLMKFPGEKNVEFVTILPFTPANRNNLIGWIAARSDGEAYGSLRAYQFPKTRFVDGPLQVQARIDQDPQLSSQLTLWNQQGSTVIRGNLLVLPLEDTLLYAEPIYLQAERSPMPELRLVVLITQDQLAYGPRFPEALTALLQGQSVPPPQQPETTSAEPVAIGDLIQRANQALSDYRRLTAEGKLGEAGLKLEELKRVLEEMNRLGVPQK
ncbi:MAG: UPF0182 family protein, partial [Acidobacteria bacterium]|nr:UPF0182 family protein [Acidobacteriota bacterium]